LIVAAGANIGKIPPHLTNAHCIYRIVRRMREAQSIGRKMALWMQNTGKMTAFCVNHMSSIPRVAKATACQRRTAAGSEIRGDALNFPVAVADRVKPAASAQFRCLFGRASSLPPCLSLGQRALCLGRERFFGCRGCGFRARILLGHNFIMDSAALPSSPATARPLAAWNRQPNILL
jgi:hypothetical protein